MYNTNAVLGVLGIDTVLVWILCIDDVLCVGCTCIIDAVREVVLCEEDVHVDLVCLCLVCPVHPPCVESIDKIDAANSSPRLRLALDCMRMHDIVDTKEFDDCVLIPKHIALQDVVVWVRIIDGE